MNFWQNSAINQSQRKSIQKPLYSKMLHQENNCPLQISMLIDLKYSFYIRLFTRECYLEYTKLFFIWIKSWKLYFYNGYLVPLKGDVQLMFAMHKINFFYRNIIFRGSRLNNAVHISLMQCFQQFQTKNCHLFDNSIKGILLKEKLNS